MRVVIIDGEFEVIESLKTILANFVGNIEVVGCTNSPADGIRLIEKTKPDVVFLDIEMPNGSGFDVLEGVSNRNFDLVFISAYAHYAIRAIKANAIDYLLKPINKGELMRAINNVKKRFDSYYTMRNQSSYAIIEKEILTKIPISLKNEYLLLDLEDIQYIESDGAYSIIHTFDEHYKTAKNLKYYETLLMDNDFLRVSNSSVVNIEKVVKYLREDGGAVELRNKIRIPVSRNRKGELKTLLRI